ncbi:unnamed protein product [Urochloa humidicola]
MAHHVSQILSRSTFPRLLRASISLLQSCGACVFSKGWSGRSAEQRPTGIPADRDGGASPDLAAFGVGVLGCQPWAATPHPAAPQLVTEIIHVLLIIDSQLPTKQQQGFFVAAIEPSPSPAVRGGKAARTKPVVSERSTMPRIRHAWLWRRHYLYYRLQAAVSSYIPVNNLFSDECLKAGKPLDIYQKRTLQTSGNQGCVAAELACLCSHCRLWIVVEASNSVCTPGFTLICNADPLSGSVRCNNSSRHRVLIKAIPASLKYVIPGPRVHSPSRPNIYLGQKHRCLPLGISKGGRSHREPSG